MPKTKIVDMTPVAEFDPNLKGKTVVLKTMNVGKRAKYYDDLQAKKEKDGIYPAYYGNLLFVNYMLVESPFGKTFADVENLEPEVFEFLLKECKEMIDVPLVQKSNSSSNEPTETDGQKTSDS